MPDHPFESLNRDLLPGLTWRDDGPPAMIYWSQSRRWLVQKQHSDASTAQVHARAAGLEDKGLQVNVEDARGFAQALHEALMTHISKLDLTYLARAFGRMRGGQKAPAMPWHALPEGMATDLQWQDREGPKVVPRGLRQRWVLQLQQSDLPIGGELARVEQLAAIWFDAGDLDSQAFASAWGHLLGDDLTPRNLEHLVTVFEQALADLRAERGGLPAGK